MIKGSYGNIGTSPLVIILLSLVAIGTLVIEIKWFLILFLMIFDNELIKLYHHSSKLGAHRRCGSGDIMVLICHVILQDHAIKS